MGVAEREVGVAEVGVAEAEVGIGLRESTGLMEGERDRTMRAPCRQMRPWRA